MKTTKVKGFTLIELIVVMAIFGVILAGAMSLMQPVSKVMVQSETYEGGNAAVQSITNYLEKSMASAEFMDSYNYIPDLDAAVLDYATFYYEGVLKDNTTADMHTVNYADGKIHALVIDNTGIDSETGEVSTQIKEYVYGADFTNGAVNVWQESAEENVINKAYYDNYDFQIKVGDHDELDWGNIVTQTEFGDDVSEGLQFTIKATTKKRANGQLYSFFTNTSMTFANFAVPTQNLRYYVISDAPGDDEGDLSDNTQTIGPISSAGSWSDSTPLSRTYGALLDHRRLKNTGPEEVFNSMCFIYSYGAEINTKG